MVSSNIAILGPLLQFQFRCHAETHKLLQKQLEGIRNENGRDLSLVFAYAANIFALFEVVIGDVTAVFAYVKQILIRLFQESVTQKHGGSVAN
jgi:hypothetical protein